MTREELVRVPRFYIPRPHQLAAWKRRSSGKYDYYIKLWARQLGKDTDDIEFAMNWAWRNPGTQTAYIGLDNVWVNNNIFKKYIEGRTFWQDYPDEYIDPKDTQKEVFFGNNPQEMAPARIKFIGFLNDEGIIGSSYDSFYISEASLYRKDAFRYITPIWDRKKKETGRLSVNFNGTPRGMKNVLYDLLRTYTGVDDPNEFPGEHILPTHTCYVDKVTIEDALLPDGRGGWKPMYTKQEIEELRARDIRAYGNDAFFNQENYVEFTTVNAGLVYRGIEELLKEKRYTKFNLDTRKPLYVAFDISSKDKVTDSTAAIIYQWIEGRMMIYDIYEARGISLVEAIGELAKKDYFHLIRLGVLPWDSERSASSETPIEEARRMFPRINWHALDKERVDRGITLVREALPNMWINSDTCDWLVECFNNYEYKRLEKADDWQPKPKHNRYSHLMDALRYAVMGVHELKYFQMNEYGDEVLDWNLTYSDSWTTAKEPWDKPWPEHWQRTEKRTNGGFYYYG